MPLLALLLALSLLLPPPAPARATPVHGYEVVGVYPHDPDAYTQGLVVSGGFLYEGTGLHGESTLRKIEIDTGEVLIRHDLPPQFFGEGITALRDTLYQLTWQEHVGFTYVETDSFELVETFPYAWQGWGITHDGTHLIVSNGSPRLRFLDPATREEVRSVQVEDDGVPVAFLNELEYVHGQIYANVWQSTRIAVIQPGNGVVASWIELAGLADSVSAGGENVLNGIAYDPEARRLFVTGKRWPKVFEIDTKTLHVTGVGPPASDDSGLELRSFPLPCGDRAWVTFTLPRNGRVSMELFGTGGRRLRTLLDEHRSAGLHSVPVETTGLPGGVYFMRVTTEGARSTNRIVVVR